MNFRPRHVSILLLSVLLIALIVPVSAAGNYQRTFSVQPTSKLINNHFKVINIQMGILSKFASHELYVSTPPSLLDYYGNLTHTINDNPDYAQFVTPQAVASIATCIEQVTNKLPQSNEQFADAVLGLVHQIPYNVTDPKYPVETLVDNYGDCVGLSLLTASIMEAGGLDVVLILYTGINPEHMNVGVYLPYTPVYHTALMPPTSFRYDNKTYWTAEATPDGDWKVGDQSFDLANAQANIIPLGNVSTQPTPPGTVSASLNTQLPPSNITINLTEDPTNGENNSTRDLAITGSITPSIPDQPVTIYLDNNNQLMYFSTVTDDEGNYCLTWNFTDAGTYSLTAAWSGVCNCTASDSEPLTVFAGPQSIEQFQGSDYNYIFTQVGLASIATEPMQGVNNFLSVPLGSNASLSYDFIILQAGHTVSNVPTATITIPESEETVLTGTRSRQTIIIPAYNVTVPEQVPIGLEPVSLPDDLNQTLNDKFSFILQKDSAGNYSLDVKGLTDDDLAQLQTNSQIANLTESVKADTWYQMTSNINGNGSTTNLVDQNGSTIENSSTTDNQTIILITNNQDTAIVLKNLNVENTTAQPEQSNIKTNSPTVTQKLTPYVTVAILLAAVATAAIYVSKRRSKNKKD
jgi:hypothetical protein